MSNQPERKVPQDDFAQELQKRPLLSASRVVLLILLALAIAAYFWDQQARSNCQGSFDALNQAVSAREVEEEGKDYYREEVAQHMLGNYQREVNESGTETYAWTALFGLRSYCLKVEYEGTRVSGRKLNPKD